MVIECRHPGAWKTPAGRMKQMPPAIFGGTQAIRGMWKSQFCPLASRESLWRDGTSGVDPTPSLLVPLKANFRAQPSIRWVNSHDADVQSPEPEKKKQARVPGPHAEQGRAKDPQPAAPERPATAGGERRLQVGPVVLVRPGAGAPGRFRLPPSSRITRTREIRALLHRGKRKKTSHLDVFFLSSGGSAPRLGLVVPKHRQSGVDRNRVKRRLREIGRREVLPRMRDAGQSGDLLVRARREAYEASYQQLRRELIEIAEEICSGQPFWR